MTGILVTGANGFIGKAVCKTLIGAGYSVRRAIRRDPLPRDEKAHSNRDSDPTTSFLPQGKGRIDDFAAVGVIGPETDWTNALNGIDIVVHLAARAHVMYESARDALMQFRHTNTLGTHHYRSLVQETPIKGIGIKRSVT